MEKIDDIDIPHSDTPVAGGLPDLVFVSGPVNVNEAVSGVSVVPLQPIQPEDPARDQILRLGKRIVRPKRNPSEKDRSQRHIVPNLFGYPKMPERGLQASWFRAQTKTGGGNGISREHLITRNKIETLIAD